MFQCYSLSLCPPPPSPTVSTTLFYLYLIAHHENNLLDFKISKKDWRKAWDLFILLIYSSKERIGFKKSRNTFVRAQSLCQSLSNLFLCPLVYHSHSQPCNYPKRNKWKLLLILKTYKNAAKRLLQKNQLFDIRENSYTLWN